MITTRTGGTILYSFYLRADSTIRISDILGKADNAEIGTYINGNSETISIVATSLTNNASAFADINFIMSEVKD